jgi:dTDP-4-amino-4,6-dideoxygalactose transaminase
VIEFFSLTQRNAELKSDIDEAIEAVVESGIFVGGSEVQSFEESFAQYLGAPYAVAVGNGLDALRLSLIALGVGPGDEVIVPGFTFVATWLAVVQVGATVVPVDVCRETANISLAAIEGAITSRTKCAVVVHLYGRPAIDRASALALRHRGVFVLEDAAQAHGASIGGVKCGMIGDVAAFSFYPTKNLGALGDAGAVVTSDQEIAKRVKELRDYGFVDSRRSAEAEGWNSRMDPLQAAVLSKFLPHLDAWNESRRRLARSYLEELAIHGVAGAAVGSACPVCDSVWHLFVMRVSNQGGVLRDAAVRGVQLAVHYAKSPSEMRAFNVNSLVDQRFPLPNSLELARSVVSLPLYPQLEPTATGQVVAAVTEKREN